MKVDIQAGETGMLLRWEILPSNKSTWVLGVDLAFGKA